MPVTRFRPRGDTKANWTALNPILKFREMGIEYETTVGSGPVKVKFGDGIKHWNDLDYGLIDDVAEKVIKEFTTPSDENPVLTPGDTVSDIAGKQATLNTKIGYERLDALATALGAVDQKDFVSLVSLLNDLKFNKSDVYAGLDSTNDKMAASSNALRQVNEKSDSNTQEISKLSSDLNNHLCMFPNGVTAVQSQNGNIWRRLQIQVDNDDIAVFKSTDGGQTWPSVKTLITNADITFFNLLGIDISYDISANISLIRWRIRDNLSYQLCINDINIFVDRWDGTTWSRVWTK